MKRTLLTCALLAMTAFFATIAWSQNGHPVQGSQRVPPNPVTEAKLAQMIRLEDAADKAVAESRPDEAIKALEKACKIEDTFPRITRACWSKLARVFERLGRDDEALEAYRNCFWWDPNPHNWTPPRGPAGLVGDASVAFRYALLLSKVGRVEDAKTMYYFGLEQWGHMRAREHEPVPFLVIFDPDPNGVYWEYTPERFKVAIMMLQQSTQDDRAVIAQIRALVPDWFWPVAYLADQRDPIHDVGDRENAGKRAALIAEADRLAKPGLEKELMADYHKMISERPSATLDYDPITMERRSLDDGARRRALIAVLKPDPEALQRLSVPAKVVPGR